MTVDDPGADAAHGDATAAALPVNAIGQVPWWPAQRADVALHASRRRY